MSLISALSTCACLSNAVPWQCNMTQRVWLFATPFCALVMLTLLPSNNWCTLRFCCTSAHAVAALGISCGAVSKPSYLQQPCHISLLFQAVHLTCRHVAASAIGSFVSGVLNLMATTSTGIQRCLAGRSVLAQALLHRPLLWKWLCIWCCTSLSVACCSEISLTGKG